MPTTFALAVLLGAAPFAAAASEVPVYLNHASKGLSGGQIDAMKKEPFLNGQFAFTAAAPGLYEGKPFQAFYIIGETTNLEFIYPNPVLGVTPAFSGIMLGTDEAGAIDEAAQCLRRRLGDDNVVVKPEFYPLAGKPIRWFTELTTSFSQDFVSWVMEYSPDFFKAIDPAHDPDDVSRKRYLAKKYDPSRLLQDITAVKLSLSPADARKFERYLVALGYRLQAAPDGSALLVGPAIAFTLSTAGARGITEVDFSTNRPCGYDQSRVVAPDVVLTCSAAAPTAALLFK